MRTHPRIGYNILASIPAHQIGAVAEVVLHHHEAMDGTGYPDGLKGEAIPALSRIVSVADAYDAMATVRTYHKLRSHAEVMRLLFEEQGSQYDPYVLAAFTRVIDSSPYKPTAA